MKNRLEILELLLCQSVKIDCLNIIRFHDNGLYSCDMFRSYGTLFLAISYHKRIKIRCYKMFRAEGSMICVKCESSVGTTNIVETDFNPLKTIKSIQMRALGSVHI